MNNSQRLSALLLLAAASASPTLWADYTTGQPLDVNIPPTLVIAVEQTHPTITFAAPTTAGNAFTNFNYNPNPSGRTFKVAMTSNISSARLYAHARRDGQPLSGIALTLDSSGFPEDGHKAVDFDDSFDNSWAIGNIATGTLTGSPQTTKTMQLGASAVGSDVPPSGTYTITLTFTLKDS